VLRRAFVCRLVLEMQTSSGSMSVSEPTPERASASTAHEPTPPSPTTQTCEPARFASEPGPYSRSTPSKRSA